MVHLHFSVRTKFKFNFVTCQPFLSFANRSIHFMQLAHFFGIGLAKLTFVLMLFLAVLVDTKVW